MTGLSNNPFETIIKLNTTDGIPLNKKYINYMQANGHIMNIVKYMYIDDFRPDYVVGIVRGGSVPALHISHLLDISCKMVNVKIAGNKEFHGFKFIVDEVIDNDKKILIIDDINDTGFTFNNLRKHCTEYAAKKWLDVDDVYANVRTAALVNNAISSYEVDYSSMQINKAEEDCWIEFPWENWWKG